MHTIRWLGFIAAAASLAATTASHYVAAVLEPQPSVILAETTGAAVPASHRDPRGAIRLFPPRERPQPRRILLHADPRITMDVYGHLDLGDMLTAVNRLPVTPARYVQTDALSTTRVAAFGTPVVRGGGARPNPKNKTGSRRPWSRF